MNIATGAVKPGESALYVGKVMHQRLKPARHRFSYRVFSLLVDVDELPLLAKRLKLFSLDRFNLFSLYVKDYGAGSDVSLRSHVEQQLSEAGLATGGAIRLLTMPRILGYAFNPLSVYYCHRPDGVLHAVLYEVNNTFGERHGYLVEVDEPGDATVASVVPKPIAQACDKNLYVSPFLGMDMSYRFRIEPPSIASPSLSIGIVASSATEPMLIAHYEARRCELSDRTLALAFVSHPLLTLKVIGAIHWEALRLWIKGVGLQPRPAEPTRTVSIVRHREQ
ncbi:DUF1365 domain-containing protein [soil metagenome]